MSICNQKILAESAAAGVSVAGLAVLWSSSDPWLSGVAVHPAWLAILAMSAFYGLRGLLMSLPVVWGSVAFAAGLVGASRAGAFERATSTTDALILFACVVAAAVAMAHARRQRRLEEERDALRDQSDLDGNLIGSLRTTVGALRDRHDRVDLAISFWRDIAGRLESGDDSAAAKAALELCMQRTGARAGIVRRYDGNGLHNVAFRGRWTRNMPTPRDIFRDNTLNAAIERGTTVLADEVRGSVADDADIAAAVTAADGSIVGVIGLRGISRTAIRASEIRDLTATAQWLAIALCPDDRRPDARITTPTVRRGYPPRLRAATEPSAR